jgi:phage gpG-like protein
MQQIAYAADERTVVKDRGAHIQRSVTGWLVLGAIVIGTSALGATAIAWGRTPLARAHAARMLNVRDEGRLLYIKTSGSVVIDEGRAAGTFPGSVKVRFSYDGEPTVNARFTISGANGSISARGTARLNSLTSLTPSFTGTMTITGGSGRYAHIHGSGGLYGVYSRRNYGLTVQAIGKLPY